MIGGDFGMSLHDRIEIRCISFMHDTMYSLFMKPEKLLIPAGLQEGQVVLEVGCGPGFFTIPAAEIVGDNGFIYANDINQFAIKKVEKKIAKKNIKNVKPMLEDVTKTSLPNNSIDLAFFFGVIHSLSGFLDKVLIEMDKVIKEDGLIAIQKTRKKGKDIINEIEKSGKFILIEESKRILKFQKKLNNC